MVGVLTKWNIVTTVSIACWWNTIQPEEMKCCLIICTDKCLAASVVAGRDGALLLAIGDENKLHKKHAKYTVV